jgi:hypothetical protein
MVAPRNSTGSHFHRRMEGFEQKAAKVTKGFRLGLGAASVGCIPSFMVAPRNSTGSHFHRRMEEDLNRRSQRNAEVQAWGYGLLRSVHSFLAVAP